jgi:uncharacterized protein YqeY
MIEKLKADLQSALKRGDKTAVATLRLLMSESQYARMQLKRDLQEEDYITLFQRAVKTRREAIEQFEKGGHMDRANQERAEIAVVERYLPARMSEAEVERAVEALIQELEITHKKDLGRAMKEFMSRYRGRVDGKMVNAFIAAKLA